MQVSKINIEECIELYKIGWSFNKLAERYSVSKQRIQQKLKKLNVITNNRPIRCSKCNVIVESVLQDKRYGTFCDLCRVDRNKCSKCGNYKYERAKTCFECYKYSCQKIDRELLIHLWNVEKLTLKQIAEQFDTTSGTIENIMVKLRKKGVQLEFRNKGYINGSSN